MRPRLTIRRQTAAGALTGGNGASTDEVLGAVTPLLRAPAQATDEGGVGQAVGGTVAAEVVVPDPSTSVA